MEHTAFALRDDYAGTVTVNGEEVPAFSGGVLAVPPDGRSFDVAKKLDDGGGAIVVNAANTPLVELLRKYPALEEVPVPEGAVDTSSYEDWTVPQLRDELERRDLPRGGTKAELSERLTANDADREAGGTDNDDQEA